MTLEEILKRIRKSDGSMGLTDTQREAIEFFGNTDASMEDVSNDKLKSMMDELGGFDNAIAIRSLALSNSEGANGLSTVVHKHGSDSWDAILECALPIELMNELIATAEHVLSRKTNRSRLAATQTTAAFTQARLDTKVISKALQEAQINRDEFQLIVANRLVDSMLQRVSSMRNELQATNSPTAASDKLLEALTQTNQILKGLEPEQRIAYCLRDFMEYEVEAGRQLIGVPTEHFIAFCETTEAILSTALGGERK